MAVQRNYYVVGNNAVSVERPERERQEQQISSQAIRNRERSLRMNLGYVIFLSLMAAATVLICVNYLRLQSKYTTLQKQSTALEATLGSLRIANDTEYNRIVSSINLENVKETAMNRLGMVYASEDQIITYEAKTPDYVKQYQALPD